MIPVLTATDVERITHDRLENKLILRVGEGFADAEGELDVVLGENVQPFEEQVLVVSREARALDVAVRMGAGICTFRS